MDGRRRGWMAIALAASLAGAGGAPAAAASPSALGTEAAGGPRGGGGVEALAAPVLWMLGVLGVPVESAPLPNSQALERSRELQTLEFPVADDGLGVYLEVTGRARFEHATVRLGDGSARELDLRGAVRGRGLYALCAFDGPTRVEAVTVRARAAGSGARVGVRLGR